MSQENVNCVLSVSRRKQFAECKMELFRFDSDVIATSANDDIGGADPNWFTGGAPANESGSVDPYGQGA